MIQFFTKKDGAVSVFLAIILVPMIVVSCLFVDASRIKLAKGVVGSAGDLSLNATLTQYDAVLNDYYGLLASCQTVDEFYKTAGDYFTACIESQGIDKTTSKNLGNQVLSLLTGGDGEIVDLLKMTETEGGSFTVSDMANGNLTNPALVKKEIVEFMKYRAPINAIQDIIEKFKDSSKSLENSEDDAELTEKKQAYYETESQVVKKALEAYNYINDYITVGITESYINDIKTELNNIEDTYKWCHSKMVMDLYNTQNLKGTYGNIVYNPSFSTSNIKAKQIASYLNNAASTMDTFVSTVNGAQQAINACPVYNSNTMYELQVWVATEEVLNQNSNFQNVDNRANDMISNIEKLKYCMSLCTDEEKSKTHTLQGYSNVNTSGEKTIQEHYDAMISQYDSLMREHLQDSGSGDTNNYASIIEALSRYKSDCNSLRSTSDVNTKISSIYQKLSGYTTAIDKAKECLTNAVASLNDLKDLIAQYKTAQDNWTTKADSYDSTLSEQDRTEIKLLETDIIDNVTNEKIQALSDRLNNIKSLLGSVQKGMDEYKYNQTSVTKIDGYTAFKNASAVSADKISYEREKLNSYIEESWKFTTSSTISTASITQKNHPDISVNTPELYNWMKKKFTQENQSNMTPEEAEAEYEKAGKEHDSEVSDLLPGNYRGGNEVSGISNKPSASYSAMTVGEMFENNLTKMSGFVTGLFGDIGGTLSKSLVSLRDDLYALDYITSMFSYDTFEQEGKYKLKQDNKSEDDWTSTDLKFTENKTLTNKMINTGNNYAYGNEVEYIIYGGKNEQNKNSSYGTIFALRFVLDLLPQSTRYLGYSCANEPDVASLNYLATSIAAATYGVIPAMLVKIVVVLGQTAAEAANDIGYLQKGKPVVLVRTNKQLEVTFSKMANYQRKEEDMENGFFYSDYLKLILFLKLSAGDEYGIYARTADVIQANMANKISGNAEFVMSKAIVYFQAQATVQVEPLMLNLPIVTNYGVEAPESGAWNTITYQGTIGY